MAKKINPTSIVPTTASAEYQVPDFMRQHDMGVEDLSQFIIPPRVKLVQKQSGAPFEDLFSPGDVVVVPQMLKVAGTQDKAGEPFHFIPLFFYPEWALWNPLELRGQQPAIRQRTTDPRSPMVAKCRDSSLWLEPCPEMPDKNCRYVEHLNFIIMLLGDHQAAGIPIVMSFARAEHRSGSNFAALIKMRRAPLYGCHFEARAAYRSNNKGQWYGLDITNPAADSGVLPFVQDQATFETLKAHYEELKKAHAESKIRVDYEDAPDTTPSDTLPPDTEM